MPELSELGAGALAGAVAGGLVLLEIVLLVGRHFMRQRRERRIDADVRAGRYDAAIAALLKLGRKEDAAKVHERAGRVEAAAALLSEASKPEAAAGTTAPVRKFQGHIREHLACCPKCGHAPLDAANGSVTCGGCSQVYPVDDGIPQLFYPHDDTNTLGRNRPHARTAWFARRPQRWTGL